jgi:hypothetical protein
MKKKPRQDIYKTFSIIDVIVVMISLIAFATLLYMVKYYYDSSRIEQEILSVAGTSDQGIKSAGSINEMIDFLVINEINQTGWIELYNIEKNVDIELSNCYITVNDIRKYTFSEDTVITSGEFLCVEGFGWLGKTEHDIIGIFDEKGNNLKNILIPRLDNKESYGCRTDGDISYCYLTASKEKTNFESNLIKKDKLIFSVPGGFYDESFQLEIAAADGMDIYYTLDGTEPTIKSEAYETPILIENKSGSDMQYAIAEGIDYINSYQPTSISMGMVVRAIAVDSKGITSEVKSQSYFVGLKKASDLANIPVLSIITAPENLFNYFDGIYVSGRSHEDALARGEDGGDAANYLNGWKKEVTVEYFEPQKDKTYEGNMSISIMNDNSVTSPQKSLLFTAEGGAFAGSSLMNYYNDISKRLIVQTNRKDNNYKLREYLAGELLEDTNISTPDIKPCIVFINGEYWGGYMIRAEYDEKYIEKHYGVKNDVLIAQNGKIINRSDYQQQLDEMYDFIANNDLKVDENYAWVKARLDVQNYLENLCVNVYLANAEFDPDNLVMWRTINDQGTGYEDGKWRFLLPRLDNTMQNGMAGRIATSSINTFLQTGVFEDSLFKSLVRNDEFKNQLSILMTEMADDIFTEERVHSLITQISSRLKKMTVMSYKRFIGNQGDTFYTKEVEKIESFFQQRGKYILLYTKEVSSGGRYE